MTLPLRIQAATADDLPDLLALYQHLIPGDAAPDPGTAAAILDLFHRYPGSTHFLARLDGQPVAASTLIVVPNLTRGGSPFGLIENVVTHAAFRQRGFGRQVLDAATVAAWAAGCYKLMLMTGATDPGTLDFYRKAGFAQTKTAFQKRRIAPRAAATADR